MRIRHRTPQQVVACALLIILASICAYYGGRRQVYEWQTGHYLATDGYVEKMNVIGRVGRFRQSIVMELTYTYYANDGKLSGHSYGISRGNTASPAESQRLKQALVDKLPVIVRYDPTQPEVSFLETQVKPTRLENTFPWILLMLVCPLLGLAIWSLCRREQ
jgi:hypothetical protein